MKSSIMSTKETALYLNVSQDTIYKMARAQQIPHFRIRGKLAFNVESIDRWRFQSE